MHRQSVAPSEHLIRDGNAIGGYHRRLRSTAPLELLDFSNVWRFPDRAFVFFVTMLLVNVGR